MKKQLLGIIFAALIGATPANAADCGEQPMDHPSLPNGETANAGDIRTARDAVVAYSTKVDEFLTCMDQRATLLLPYMTKEQKVRWDEDLADLHDVRRELQNKMNLAIRAYRRSQRDN